MKTENNRIQLDRHFSPAETPNIAHSRAKPTACVRHVGYMLLSPLGVVPARVCVCVCPDAVSFW